MELYRQSNKFKRWKLNQLGFDHAFVAIARVIGNLLIVQSHAYTNVWKGVLEEGSSTSGYYLTAAGSTNNTTPAKMAGKYIRVWK